MSGFTPGPWMAGINWVCPGELKGAFVKSNNTTIADVSAVKVKSQKVCEANARLIAAAPDMYALLEETLGHVDEWNFPVDLRGRIEAALKKARGSA